MRISDWSSDVCSSYLGTILTIWDPEPCKIVEPKNERAAETACCLKPALKSRQLVERRQFVEDVPGPKLARMGERHDRIDRDIHPKRQQRLRHIEVGISCRDEQIGRAHV